MRARLCALLLIAGCSGPSVSAAPLTRAEAPTPPMRSLYVSSFADEGEAALELAAAHGIGELTLYGLRDALRTDDPALLRFFEAARERDVHLVAPVAGLDRVEDLARWQRAHPDARFTGWVTELEFWNAPGEERAAAFASLQTLLTSMRAAKQGGWVGCYLGYPSAEEARFIAAHVDRVYLSFGIADPSTAAEWGEGVRSHRARHARFAGRVSVWPIVYARGDAHMRPWLEDHGVRELERTMHDELGGQLDGIAYFDFRAAAPIFSAATNR